jgi:glycerol-3-phosphate acyltransferase PlsY
MTDAILFGLVAYAVGCACAGYYLVRLVAAEDIRLWGSGACGATNVGRRLGPGAFAVTLVLDGAKGVAVAWAAARFGFGPTETAAAIVAAVSGHIWPVQLGFRGGKGIATSLGAFAVYDVRIVLVIASIFLAWYVVVRAFVASGLLAYLLSPLLLAPLGLPAHRILTLTAVVGVVLIAHREDVRTTFAERRVAE